MEQIGPCPLCGGEAEKKFTDVELWMRDNILFIGDEIPEGIAADLRNKFVLLGMPQLLIDVAEKELSAIAAQNRRMRDVLERVINTCRNFDGCPVGPDTIAEVCEEALK